MPTLPIPASAISLGQTRTTVPTPVDLPRETLVRHTAFLGGSGSGKTTLPLIEQLLLRGVPAILLDRKGDLCSYANSEAWEMPTDDPRLMAYRQLLHDHIDVAVYTPGTLVDAGRPLSIAITPPGLGQLPGAERQQMANYCAAPLGGIMGYMSAVLDKKPDGGSGAGDRRTQHPSDR
uniref:helicase HerA domain-containing protein n=1 Tax=Petrachloros mirabilis TaxID=2918835 RepID=UPI0030844476